MRQKRKRPRFSYFVAILFLVVWVLAGCLPPEPQVIPITRVVEVPGEAGEREVTRWVTQVVTATPPPPTPTATPPIVRLYWAPETTVQPEVATEMLTTLRLTGLEVQAHQPQSYAEVIAALCAGEADVAWMATPAYLWAHEACGAEALFSVVRDGRPTHAGQILVQEDAARTARGLQPLRSVEDLQGKILGFTDPRSTTGYLFPKALLVQAGTQPTMEVFLGGDVEAVLAVYKGEVDAAATYWAPPRADGSPGDARSALMAKFPDVTQKIKILVLTPAVPNDPLVVRRDLAPAVRAKLVAALVELTRSEEGRQLLRRLYRVEGLAPVGDQDYDPVRQMLGILDVEPRQLLRGPGESG
jgi:phosphonate transport system substrate-binding protein